MASVGVESPDIRMRLSAAVASLGDEDFQDRLWRRGERLNNDELGFDDAMLVVIDELESSAQDELVGYVLRDDDELAAFRRLSAALESLVLVIGSRGTFEDALATGEPWQEVT